MAKNTGPVLRCGDCDEYDHDWGKCSLDDSPKDYDDEPTCSPAIDEDEQEV